MPEKLKSEGMTHVALLRKPMDLINIFFNILDRITKMFSLVTLSVGVLMMGVEVTSRYLVGISHDWFEYGITYIIMSGVYLNAGITLYSHGHVRVDFLIERMPARRRQVLEIFLNLIVFGTCLIMAVWSWQYIMVMKDLNVLLPISLTFPRWPADLGLFFGMFIITIYGIRRIAESLIQVVSGKNLS